MARYIHMSHFFSFTLQNDRYKGVYGISSCPNSYPKGDPDGFLCSYIDGTDKLYFNVTESQVYFQNRKCR